VSPHHPTISLGSIISSPVGSPAENGFYAYLRSEKKPSGTPFSVFLSDGVHIGGPPKRRGARENFPLPFLPSRPACPSLAWSVTLRNWPAEQKLKVVLVVVVEKKIEEVCCFVLMKDND